MLISLIKESFLGYKYRKMEHKLYDSDKDIPIKLIRLYYTFKDNESDEKLNIPNKKDA